MAWRDCLKMAVSLRYITVLYRRDTAIFRQFFCETAAGAGFPVYSCDATDSHACVDIRRLT